MYSTFLTTHPDFSSHCPAFFYTFKTLKQPNKPISSAKLLKRIHTSLLFKATFIWPVNSCLNQIIIYSDETVAVMLVKQRLVIIHAGLPLVSFRNKHFFIYDWRCYFLLVSFVWITWPSNTVHVDYNLIRYCMYVLQINVICDVLKNRFTLNQTSDPSYHKNIIYHIICQSICTTFITAKS